MKKNDKITIDSLAKAISGKIVGANNFKSPEGFTGIFNILKDSKEGDIVIRHWIDEVGVEIASGKHVACVITEDPRGNSIEIAKSRKFPLIVVNKIEEANAYALKWTIAKFAPNSKRVIISGTNGKSTTSDMIYHILKSTGANALTNTDSRSEFNTLIDPMVPKLISEEFLLNGINKLDYIVIEASEVQGWLGKLMKGHAYLMTEAVDPDAAVITNIAMDHIGLVNSIEEVFQETSGVAKAIKKGSLILNHDDELVLDMNNFIDENINGFYFSMENFNKNKYTTVDIRKKDFFNGEEEILDVNGGKIFNDTDENIVDISEVYSLKYDSSKESIIYNNNNILFIDDLPFKSNHFIQNTLAAISACLALKINVDDIVRGVKSYQSLNRRFKIISHNPLIIDDFAHNPEGIKATANAVIDLAKDKIDNDCTIRILCAIRGSRGEEINKINAEAIVDIINDFSNMKHKETKLEIKIILSSSCDVVDDLNVVEDYEKDIFFDVFTRDGIDYIHYENLQDALFETYNLSKDDDVILLIGAQGMDPAESLLKNIINKKDIINKNK
ncbi:UDP-N-acetylmuramate--L-alanine ligase [Methanobrevibacter cuticularis]|uniref:UDP-N-acetylmuramate--L-alanine ligase n=1 Tax=Methanobrevibacter cuticularis TaxID=47311 RepID=A0A166E3H9_9EURY|nr:Mur ligase family protein [Methanobrevibacter cuticularis]KZX16241.1 UDP-N-acetylmuramate--L-alanine ligase [Methanobrevibacter cuticularis]